MIALVDGKKPEIIALRKRFGIRRLDLFGSAATGAFDPVHSDLDFVVDLGIYERGCPNGTSQSVNTSKDLSNGRWM